MADFYDYFKENMEALGLPAPAALYGNVTTAAGTASLILSQIDKFGKGVTVGELIGAGTKLEMLGVVSAVSASFYVGAVIGSIAVATGRSLAGGTSMGDVLLTAHKYGINRPWLTDNLRRWPGVYDRNVGHRRTYRHRVV